MQRPSALQQSPDATEKGGGHAVAVDGQEAPARASFGDAFRFWLKLGFLSFGGPAGQIAMMHRELTGRSAKAQKSELQPETEGIEK